MTGRPAQAHISIEREQKKSRGAGGAFVHLPTNRSGLASFTTAREASTYLRSVPCGIRNVCRIACTAQEGRRRIFPLVAGRSVSSRRERRCRRRRSRRGRRGER